MDRNKFRDHRPATEQIISEETFTHPSDLEVTLARMDMLDTLVEGGSINAGQQVELQELLDVLTHMGARSMKKNASFDAIKNDPEAAAGEFGKLKPHLRKSVATGASQEWDVDAGQLLKGALASMLAPGIPGAYTGYRAGRRDALVKLRKEHPEIFKKALELHKKVTGENYHHGDDTPAPAMGESKGRTANLIESLAGYLPPAR